VAEYASDRVKSALGRHEKFDVVVHERLQPHVRYVEKHTAELARATERAVMRHKKRIIERQMVVERLADMAGELYARTAVISRTQRLVEERGAAACERELELCDLFCVTSGRRFRDARIALQEGGETIDDRRRAIAARLREEQGYHSPATLVEFPVPPRAAPTLEAPTLEAPTLEAPTLEAPVAADVSRASSESVDAASLTSSATHR
jgi:acyl-CoA dehydrogenase family protein 9